MIFETVLNHESNSLSYHVPVPTILLKNHPPFFPFKFSFKITIISYHWLVPLLSSPICDGPCIFSRTCITITRS